MPIDAPAGTEAEAVSSAAMSNPDEPSNSHGDSVRSAPLLLLAL